MDIINIYNVDLEKSRYNYNESINNIINTYYSINTYYLSIIINYLLVCNDLRCGYLLESSNLNNYQIELSDVIILFDTIKTIYNSNGYTINIDHIVENRQYGRYLFFKRGNRDCLDKINRLNSDIVNHDISLGHVLGYYCNGDDYSNVIIKRYSINYIAIKTDNFYSDSINIYSESCVFISEESLKDTISFILNNINNYNNLLKNYGLIINGTINIDDGLQIRSDKLDDNKYINSHNSYYINDIYNIINDYDMYNNIIMKLQGNIALDNNDKYLLSEMYRIYGIN